QRYLLRAHGHRSKASKQKRIGPVDILEHNHSRLVQCGFCHKSAHSLRCAAKSGCVVHCVKDRLQVLTLIEIQQIGNERLLRGFDASGLDAQIEGCLPVRIRGMSRKSEQGRDHSRKRCLALAHTEVEYPSDMT